MWLSDHASKDKKFKVWKKAYSSVKYLMFRVVNILRVSV